MPVYTPSSNDALIDDDTLMTKEELHATIDNALREVAQGKCRVIRSDKELHDYFASL
jgi:DNA-directed RNA polymerase subunit K/omega